MGRPLADPELDRRIVMAVFELVAQHGVDGLGMRQLAAATGLSTGTLNYRFGNKRGLLDAAIDYAYQRPRDLEEHTASTRATLERLLRRYLLRDKKVRVWWRFYCALVAHAPTDRALARRLTQRRRALVTFFADVLETGIARRELALEAPTACAERLVAIAHGAALSQLVDPSEAVLHASEQLLAAEVARICESRTTVQLSGA
ncbi:MAG: TetR/AcrR family transcriptional regulator [Myxococcota bacterium]|nr:TetR/AcrR family transcriptional regulator [Myxococcota bacterium]